MSAILIILIFNILFHCIVLPQLKVINVNMSVWRMYKNYYLHSYYAPAPNRRDISDDDV